MRGHLDPLYNIFEQHLFNALVENEGTDDFLARVVQDYLGRLSAQGTLIPQEHRQSIEVDLRDEVLEMLRKKTYGHFNLSEFRKAKGPPLPEAEAPAPQTQTRRSRRAC